MTVDYRRSTVVESVETALREISHTHSQDFIDSLSVAYINEKSPAAKRAIARILTNSKMAYVARRPICQDTGQVQAHVEVGIDARFERNFGDFDSVVNEAVSRTYTDPSNPLRASIIVDTIGSRSNTNDNTPAVVHTRIVSGSGLSIQLSAKGGGSENRAVFTVLRPTDSILDWVLETIRGLGAGWCPPGVLGVGIGGSAELAMLLAKQSLFEPIDMPRLKEVGPKSAEQELRVLLYDSINELGIGAQGLGGSTTVLDVKLRQAPTHAASLPVALVPNCAANRHTTIRFDKAGEPLLENFSIRNWPEITESKVHATKVNLDSLSRSAVKRWRVGDELLLSGGLYVMRDKAHKKLFRDSGQNRSAIQSICLEGKVIYYCGPVDPTGDEAVGPAGPTTSSRMDEYLNDIHRHNGVLASIGKANRSSEARSIISNSGSAYLVATGGAAYLLSQAVTSSEIVAFPELGMEAIRRFVVDQMPVTVAIDSTGADIFSDGPKKWSVSTVHRHRTSTRGRLRLNPSSKPGESA